MASTYSTNLRLELIGSGEQQGTWGTTTNTNLGTLLEQAIGGYEEVTMADANYTLTANNGSTDQSRNAVLKIISSVSLTATRNVVCPTIEKTYVVWNATTGSQSIQFKTSAGTGVTIPNGATAFIYVNGSDVGRVFITSDFLTAASIGTTVQGYDADLAAIAALATTDNNVIVGNGTTWVAESGATARTSLGLGTGDSPQFTAIELGAASDTTLTRSSAGVLAVEGVTVALNSTSATHTAGTIELGNASDTTISRSSAGVIAVEGTTVSMNSTSATHTAGTIELGAATDTTISRSSAGVIAVEGVTVALNSTSATHTAGTIELGAATDTTLSRSAAGRLAVEGVNVALNTDIVGRQTIWVPASAMITRTTNGAASGSVETSTNKVMIATYDFDTTTQEFVQFMIQMPTGWNESTLLLRFLWSHPATTTNFGVAWQAQAAAFADNDGLDGLAFGSAVTVTDTGGTTNNLYITAESAAMTVAGSPTAGEYVVFQVARAPANAGDTLAVDARLHGVRVIYTTDAAVDA